MNPVRKALAIVALFVVAHTVQADPFVLEAMPSNFDGLVHSSGLNRKPIVADFDQDGFASWYAGGEVIASYRQPTIFDPSRFETQTLPAITLANCPNCLRRPLAFAVADITGEGNQDIVRVFSWQGNPSVITMQFYQGNGNRGFTLSHRQDWTENSPVEWGEVYVQTVPADLDRDGDIDIAVLKTYDLLDSSGSSSVARGSLFVLWNNLGTLSAPANVQAVNFPRASQLFSGDFDRDGDIDLYTNEYYSGLSSGRYFLNNGSGSFVGQNDDNAKFCWTMADIDQDSWLDLIAPPVDGVVVAKQNAQVQSDGTWNAFYGGFAYASYGFGHSSQAVAIADMDEDARVDLITAEGTQANDSRRLTLRRRNPSSFQVGAAEVIATLPTNIVQIGVGDIRGDGDLDLMLRLSDGSFRMVRNTKPSQFARGEGKYTVIAQAGLTRLRVADLNRDGQMDILALQPGNAKLHRSLAASGGFGPSEFKILAGAASDFSLADINRDGRTDIAYVLPDLGKVRTITQNSSPFIGWSDVAVADIPGAGLIETGDVLNVDTRPDFLIGSTSTGALHWLRGNTAGGFTVSTPRSSYGAMPDALAVVPFYNGFGDTAFACASDGIAFGIEGYSNILGWFRSARLVQVETQAQTGVCGWGNLDSDDQRELVFVSGNGHLVYWSPTDSEIVTTQTITPFAPQNIHAIATTDWDRDGRDDVLLASDDGLILLSRPEGSEAWETWLLGDASLDVAAADVNFDGWMDAIYSDATGVHVALNDSRLTRVEGTDTPPNSTLTLNPGQTGTAMSSYMVHPGRVDEDANIAITSLRVNFTPVMPPFTPLTPSQVQQAVQSVSILMDGQVIGTAGSGAVAADGSLLINYVAPLGNLVPIQTATYKLLEVRITLKPSAGSASYSNFRLGVQSGTARVLRPDQSLGISSTFETTAYTTIQISPVLFSNSFE